MLWVVGYLMNLVLIKTYMEQEIFAIFETYFLKFLFKVVRKLFLLSATEISYCCNLLNLDFLW